MSEQDHRAYIDYYFERPQEFQDEPIRAICGTMELRMIQEGRLTHDESEKRAEKRRKRWIAYHTAKAEALGYKIYTDRLGWDMSGLACELRRLGELG